MQNPQICSAFATVVAPTLLNILLILKLLRNDPRLIHGEFIHVLFLNGLSFPLAFPMFTVMIFLLHVALCVSSPALTAALFMSLWHIPSILFSVVLSSFSLVYASSAIFSVCVFCLSPSHARTSSIVSS